MNVKKTLELHIRGWFPQEPALAFRGIQDKKKLFNWTLLPVLAPGALMIIAAVLSADNGLNVVSLFQYTQIRPPGMMFYTILYVGIANIIAAVLGLTSGLLLLVGKRVRVSIVCLVTMVSLGLATPIFPMLDNQPWQSGSIISNLSSPMIVFPAIALILIGINYKKFITERNRTLKIQLPSTKIQLTYGLGAAGLGFIFLVISNCIVWPAYYCYLQTGIMTVGGYPLNALTLVIGVTLLLLSFSTRTKYKHTSANGSPLRETEFYKGLFRASVIANIVMVSIFFGVNLLIQPPLYHSIRANLLQWSIYLPSVLAVNALIYHHYKRRLLA